MSPYVGVLVNGRHYSHLPDRQQTELADGDEVSILPPAAGGPRSEVERHHFGGAHLARRRMLTT